MTGAALAAPLRADLAMYEATQFGGGDPGLGAMVVECTGAPLIGGGAAPRGGPA